MLTALGLQSAAGGGGGASTSVADGRDDGADAAAHAENDAELNAALLRRNESLSRFWMREQSAPRAASAGLSVLVVDNEDGFTEMLAHQLRHLGLVVRVRRCDDVDDVLRDDLVVFGPGPGDPRRPTTRLRRLRALILERVRSGRPLLAVCLSHQVLGQLAGHPIAPLAEPRQGIQLDVEVFGTPARVGFYHTFGVRQSSTAEHPELRLEASSDANGFVTAFRGPGIASIQAHLESVLSFDGERMLSALVRHALTSTRQAEAAAVV
jgi:phenazine biosynthesis protein phzE